MPGPDGPMLLSSLTLQGLFDLATLRDQTVVEMLQFVTDTDQPATQAWLVGVYGERCMVHYIRYILHPWLCMYSLVDHT